MVGAENIRHFHRRDIRSLKGHKDTPSVNGYPDMNLGKASYTVPSQAVSDHDLPRSLKNRKRILHKIKQLFLRKLRKKSTAVSIKPLEHTLQDRRGLRLPACISSAGPGLIIKQKIFCFLLSVLGPGHT